MTPELNATVEHCAQIAKENAEWHIKQFKLTGDRYYLGQWKAYYRVHKRLLGLETLNSIKTMTEAEMIYMASKYAEKGYNYEQLKYGDDLYGKEDLADEVWDYVVEYKEIGSIAFYEKYKEFKLY